MVTSAALVVIFTSFAVSYGWGMRGTVIGGEKGALIPGALLGMFLALFSGIDVISSNFWIFAAAGALGTAFGGFEPYAQNADPIIRGQKKLRDVKKYIFGLAVKGANWFGISACVLGMAFSALSGKVYKWYDIVILLALEPLIQFIGVKIFNKPYNVEKGIFPKLYFSRTSLEEWGGNTLFLISLLITFIIKRDYDSLIFAAFGIVSGSIGWVISYLLDRVTRNPLKNGKYIFGKLQTNHKIDNWKIMEFSYGAIGGGATAIAFCLTYGSISQKYNGLTSLWNPLGNMSETLAWISMTVYALFILQQFIIKKKEKEIKDYNPHVLELFERPFMLIVPLILVLLGSLTAAKFVTAFEIYWVLAEKNTFDRFDNSKFSNVMRALYYIGAAGVVLGHIFIKDAYGVLSLMFLYTVVYIIGEWLSVFSPANYAKHKVSGSFVKTLSSYGSCITVYGYFIFQTVALFAICLHYFVK